VVMPGHYVPERGDVVWLHFTSQAGHEQAGRRPAVVLSPRSYNEKVGLALFCPVTSQIKGYPFEVKLPAGLPVGGVALCDHSKVLIGRPVAVEFACRLQAEALAEILAKALTLLR